MNLVTGGTGLVGSHLILELLKRGEEVRALKRTGSDLTFIRKVFHIYSEKQEDLFNKITWVEGDLLDVMSLEDAMEGVDKLYHSAAMISFLSSERKKMFRANISGTANVVNAALEKGVQKLCHVSSIAALGRPEDHHNVIDEDLPWERSKNNSGYAVSKYRAENEVYRGIAEGLQAVIVNPSIILGIADPSKGSARLFSTVWEGMKFYPPGINGFVDVTDVVKAMILLMESNISGERFILNGVNSSYHELFRLIAKYFNKPPPTVRAWHFMIEVAWRAEMIKYMVTGKKPLITRETARTSGNIFKYSNEKICKQLDFRFTGFDETIRSYCEYYSREF